MTKKKKAGPVRAFRPRPKAVKYFMRLYVTGATPKSARAISNLRRLCDQYLPGQYELKIIDVYQRPGLVREGQIVVAPTLVKTLPLPLRRFIGDMSDLKNLLTALEIRSEAGGTGEESNG